MEEMRPDSEQLLKRIQYEEKREQEKTRGKMKVFLGYAAGTGKTYAMLEAAHEAEKSGIDVVAGYIEPHNRPDTEALREGLEEIPPLMVDYKGIRLREFDLDAALKRRPQLLLVDELAHTNVRGCRNEKRYQDVMELLQAGISVYSTVNIQHLESLNDLVGSITGIQVRERIPDYVFDQADQVEVIDIEPDDLIRRMKEGKIYGESQAERALSNFFRREKLVALREIALRRTADRVSRMAEEERSLSDNQDYHTGEHILVCITAAPSSAKVIRTAARLADAFRGRLTGLVVETAKIREADEKTKAALRENMEIAKVLGARVSDRPVCQDQQCIKNRFGEDQSSYHPAHVPVRAFGKAYLPGPQYRRIHHTGYAPDQTIPSVSDGKKEERGLEKNGSGSVTHYGCDGSGSVSVLSVSEAGTFGIGSDHTISSGCPDLLLYCGPEDLLLIFRSSECCFIQFFLYRTALQLKSLRQGRLCYLYPSVFLRVLRCGNDKKAKAAERGKR